MPDKTITQDKFNGTCDVTFTLTQEETRKWHALSQAQRKSLSERFGEMIGVRKSPRLADAIQPIGRDSASKEAAQKAQPKFTGKVRKVYETIRNTVDLGLTDEEGQELLAMSGNSYRPARRALVQLGLVSKNGEFRLTRAQNKANVWVVIAQPSDLVGGDSDGDA